MPTFFNHPYSSHYDSASLIKSILSPSFFVYLSLFLKIMTAIPKFAIVLLWTWGNYTIWIWYVKIADILILLNSSNFWTA